MGPLLEPVQLPLDGTHMLGVGWGISLYHTVLELSAAALGKRHLWFSRLPIQIVFFFCFVFFSYPEVKQEHVCVMDFLGHCLAAEDCCFLGKRLLHPLCRLAEQQISPESIAQQPDVVHPCISRLTFFCCRDFSSTAGCTELCVSHLPSLEAPKATDGVSGILI